MTSNEIKYSISEIEHMGNGGMIERVNPDKLATFLHKTLERIEKLASEGAITQAKVDLKEKERWYQAGCHDMKMLLERKELDFEPTPPPVAEEWPKEGDRHYFIHTDGTVGQDTYEEESITDRKVKEFGNMFRTRKEAEDMAEKIKFFVK